MSFIQRHWILISFLLLLLLGLGLWIAADFSRPTVAWGVTFSADYAEKELGLDWRETYLAILDDLKVDRLRLSAYWDVTEPEPGRYDFTDLDWQIAEAGKRNVSIILGVGRRLPRWPECHDPSWSSSTNSIELEERQLAYVKKVVERYKDNPNIIYWQVENEPYLSTFGICPKLNEALFREEVSLVKEMTGKPILVTDSGELSTWWPISQSGGDVLGTTLYRVVHNKYIGYFYWFTPPSFYWTRVELLKKISPIKKVIVAELQAESWHTGEKNLQEMSQAEHNQSMSVEQFKKNISFTKKAGFDEAYLWGVEWWYLMKQKGASDYWEEAKKLWNN